MLSKQYLYKNFVNSFASKLKTVVDNKQYDKVIFFCIGTDRVIGDAFGPLVGHKLKYLYKDINEVEVFGSLEKNISARNAKGVLEYINGKYSYPLIIAIDSAISKKEIIGNIVVDNKGVHLGKAFNKNIAYVGDISIKGIVSQNVNVSRYNFMLLQNTSLNLVMNLADVVSTGIYNVIDV